MKHRITVVFERDTEDYQLAVDNYPDLKVEPALKKLLADELSQALDEGILGGDFSVVSLSLVN